MRAYEREQELNIQVQSNEVGVGEEDVDVKEEVVEGEEEGEANPAKPQGHKDRDIKTQGGFHPPLC